MNWRQELGYEREVEFAALDGYVCPACVSDKYLAQIIEDAITDEPCSYCGEERAASIQILLEAVADTVDALYTDPANELPYETREGGFQGEVLFGSEIVAVELDPWSDCDRLVEDVAGAFAGNLLCKRDYFGLDQYEILVQSWDRFASQVKSATRYLFLQAGDGSGDRSGLIPPRKVLASLGRLFSTFDLFTELPAATDLFRVRIVKAGERPCTAADLGTAPPAKAMLPNRMSPAGIPMFYAALDAKTATRETYNSRSDRKREVVLARFRNTRALRMLDLTDLPAIPSEFDLELRDERDAICFLKAFERDFTKPVKRDKGAHREYVPTQVVTEYVRHRLRTNGGSRVYGVLYRSSRAGTGIAVVIFADPEHCGPRVKEHDLDPEPFLELAEVRYLGRYREAMRGVAQHRVSDANRSRGSGRPHLPPCRRR